MLLIVLGLRLTTPDVSSPVAGVDVVGVAVVNGVVPFIPAAAAMLATPAFNLARASAIQFCLWSAIIRLSISTVSRRAWIISLP